MNLAVNQVGIQMSVTARLWCVTLILLFVFIILSRFLRDGDEERDGGPETEMVTDDIYKLNA